jgi:hypothetical protein
MYIRTDLTLPKFLYDWPAEFKELWLERASIMQYDGKMSQAVAEQEAEADIRRIVERNFLNV